jgi:hypothetical protein
VGRGGGRWPHRCSNNGAWLGAAGPWRLALALAASALGAARANPIEVDGRRIEVTVLAGRNVYLPARSPYRGARLP